MTKIPRRLSVQKDVSMARLTTAIMKWLFAGIGYNFYAQRKQFWREELDNWRYTAKPKTVPGVFDTDRDGHGRELKQFYRLHFLTLPEAFFCYCNIVEREHNQLQGFLSPKKP